MLTWSTSFLGLGELFSALQRTCINPPYAFVYPAIETLMHVSAARHSNVQPACRICIALLHICTTCRSLPALGHDYSAGLHKASNAVVVLIDLIAIGGERRPTYSVIDFVDLKVGAGTAIYAVDVYEMGRGRVGQENAVRVGMKI